MYDVTPRRATAAFCPQRAKMESEGEAIPAPVADGVLTKR